MIKNKIGVAGKSVSGKVADHQNYQYSSTMGNTTQRVISNANLSSRDAVLGYLNSARTGSLVLV